MARTSHHSRGLSDRRIYRTDSEADSRAGIDAEPDLRVVGQAGDGAEAIRAALADDIDLAILDISMPQMTGLHAARELNRRCPDIRILILSMHENEQYLYESLKAGGSGYVVKSVAGRDLVEACRATMRGEPFLHPRAMTALIRDYLRRGDDVGRDDRLTSRELHVVKLIAEGYSSKEIAAVLIISEKTVDRHRAKHPHQTRDARPGRPDPLRASARTGRAMMRAVEDAMELSAHLLRHPIDHELRLRGQVR